MFALNWKEKQEYVRLHTFTRDAWTQRAPYTTLLAPYFFDIVLCIAMLFVSLIYRRIRRLLVSLFVLPKNYGSRGLTDVCLLVVVLWCVSVHYHHRELLVRA